MKKTPTRVGYFRKSAEIFIILFRSSSVVLNQNKYIYRYPEFISLGNSLLSAYHPRCLDNTVLTAQNKSVQDSFEFL